MTFPTDPDPYLLNGITFLERVEHPNCSYSKYDNQRLSNSFWDFLNDLFSTKSWLKRHGKEHNYKFRKDENK